MTVNYGMSLLPLPGGHSIEAGPRLDDLFRVILRWQLATGRLDEEGHSRSVARFQEFIVARLERGRSHLRPYAGAERVAPPVPDAA